MCEGPEVRICLVGLGTVRRSVCLTKAGGRSHSLVASLSQLSYAYMSSIITAYL